MIVTLRVLQCGTKNNFYISIWRREDVERHLSFVVTWLERNPTDFVCFLFWKIVEQKKTLGCFVCVIKVVCLLWGYKSCKAYLRRVNRRNEVEYLEITGLRSWLQNSYCMTISTEHKAMIDFVQKLFCWGFGQNKLFGLKWFMSMKTLSKLKQNWKKIQ